MGKMSRLVTETYYVREKRGRGKRSGFHRIGAVSVVQDEDGKYSRGISILPMDMIFDRIYMKELAETRALEALATKKGELPIVNAPFRKSKKGMEAVYRFMKAVEKMKAVFPKTHEQPQVCKMGYDVELSKFEKRMFA